MEEINEGLEILKTLVDWMKQLVENSPEMKEIDKAISEINTDFNYLKDGERKLVHNAQKIVAASKMEMTLLNNGIIIFLN